MHFSKPVRLSLGDCIRVRETCLALNLRSAERLVAQIYDLEMRPHGIKGTQFTLMVAIRAMQPVAISRLAKQLKIDRTTLTRNLEILQKAGFTEFQSTDDLRERPISLTVKGEHSIAEAFPSWERVQHKIQGLGGVQFVRRLVSDLKEFAGKVA